MAQPARPFRDAEAWLAERGVPHEPIRVEAPSTTDDPATDDRGDQPGSLTGGPSSSKAPHGTPDGAEPPSVTGGDDLPSTDGTERVGSGAPRRERPGIEVGVREARRLQDQSAADAALVAAEREVAAAAPDGLQDEVARAVAFVRRSTAGAPQAQGRLRDKLLERGHSEQVAALALERARRERLVDDAAMAAALVDEKRRAGHAPARIRRDLQARGFADDLLDPLLEAAESEDQEAAAFAVAAERAARLTGTPPETAYRRVVGHVARRGYPEGLARKVARAAVFDSREQQRAAGR